LLPEDEATNHSSAITRLKDQLASQTAETSAETLIVGSLAIAHHEDALALEVLDALADDPEALARWPVLTRSLADLSSGRPSGDPAGLATSLSELSASPWLLDRVKARHLENDNRKAEADAAVASAQMHAASYIRGYTLIGGIGFTLFLIGSLLLLGWPLVRRAIGKAGFLDLGDHPSPFIVGTTGRVMALWFLGFVASGMVLSGARPVDSGGTASMTVALLLGTQTLLHGGLALFLIHRLGRDKRQQIPLAIPLRLGLTGPMQGGRGVLLWLIGGLSVGVVVVVSFTLVGEVLFGGAVDTQPALDLFAEMTELGPRILVGATVVALAPVFEEILFRGFLYRNLRDAIGREGALVVSSVLFGLVHLEPHLVLPLAGLGFVLAIVFELTGSLVVPILVHATWNLGQLVSVLVLVSG
jgi:membrane protease YdiL (CAAX protease family)